MGIAHKPEIPDEAFLAQQRELLEEMRRSWTQAVDNLASEIDNQMRRRETGATPMEGFGSGEISSVELERVQDQHARAVARLAEVDAACARLDTGTYGRCEVCGGFIGTARLEAIPTAIRCIGCETRGRRR